MAAALRVSDLLPVGRKNAITGDKLCAALNCNTRQLIAAINRERKAGAPICASCADPRGYYLAEDPEELDAYLLSFTGRVKDMEAARDGMQTARNGMT